MRIIVLTKSAQGNNEVGDIYTIAKEYSSDTPLQTVYDEMREKGTWDVIIPREQELI